MTYYHDQFVKAREIPGLIQASEFENNIVRKFLSRSNFKFQVLKIKKVDNNFLEALYQLKKAEIHSRHKKPPEEQFLIHVTSASSVEYIVKDNFDWRKVTRGKFGRGTSFSYDGQYAHTQANSKIGDDRALIITKVLVTRYTSGKKNMKQLATDFDTAVGNNEKVHVKFYDNEMLPLFVVYYNSALRTTKFSADDQSFQCLKADLMRLLTCEEQTNCNVVNLLRRELDRYQPARVAKAAVTPTQMIESRPYSQARLRYSPTPQTVITQYHVEYSRWHDTRPRTEARLRYSPTLQIAFPQYHGQPNRWHDSGERPGSSIKWFIFIAIVFGIGILGLRKLISKSVVTNKPPLPSHLQWLVTYGGERGEQLAEYLVSKNWFT